MARSSAIPPTLRWVLASVVAGLIPLLVSTGWPLAVRSVLAVVAAGLGAAGGSYYSQILERRSARRDAAAKLQDARRHALGPPSAPLDPRREVVPFTGRADDLRSLVEWCLQGEQRLRLVTGPGGVGKSRLALKLIAVMRESGWSCEEVADGAEADAVPLFREAAGDGKCLLLVVDYAENRIGLVELMKATLRDEGRRLRVLLLARGTGDWWERLEAEEQPIRGLVAGAYDGRPLGNTVDPGLTDLDLVEAAVPRFAEFFGVTEVPEVSLDAGTGPFRILDLHTAALVAVLRRTGDGRPVRISPADILEETGADPRTAPGSPRGRRA